MSEDQLPQVLIDFAECIRSDSTLRERVVAANDLDGVMAIAQESGFSISKADLEKAQEIGASATNDDRELSDEELAGVAGGSWTKSKKNAFKSETANDILVGTLLVCQLGIAIK